MSYPYGRKERLKIVWEDASYTSNVQLKKQSVIFNGTKRHCGEQMIRWLVQMNFLDPVDVMKLSLRIDFRLFGRILRMWEQEKAKAKQEEHSSSGFEPSNF